MRQGYFNIIIAVLVWGSVGIVVRAAGQPPLVAATFRVLFATLALSPLLLFRSGEPSLGVRPRKRLYWWAVLLFSGFSLGVNWVFFFQAMATTSVSQAVIATYVAPVLVAIFAPLLLKERLEPRTLPAIVIAFAGLIIMVWEPGQQLRSGSLLGMGYGLVAAFFYAMVTVTGRLLSNIAPARLVLAQTAISVVVLAPVVLWTAGPAAFVIPLRSLALLALLGGLHTALGLWLYFRGVRRVKMQHVGVLSYLEPVSAIVFAYLFLGERPTPFALLGSGLVLASSALLLSRRPSNPATTSAVSSPSGGDR